LRLTLRPSTVATPTPADSSVIAVAAPGAVSLGASNPPVEQGADAPDSGAGLPSAASTAGADGGGWGEYGADEEGEGDWMVDGGGDEGEDGEEGDADADGEYGYGEYTTDAQGGPQAGQSDDAMVGLFPAGDGIADSSDPHGDAATGAGLGLDDL
jgi:hypothetical protein